MKTRDFATSKIVGNLKTSEFGRKLGHKIRVNSGVRNLSNLGTNSECIYQISKEFAEIPSFALALRALQPKGSLFFFFWFPSARPSVLRGSKITVFFSGRAITEQQIIFQSHVPPHNPYTDAHVHQET